MSKVNCCSTFESAQYIIEIWVFNYLVKIFSIRLLYYKFIYSVLSSSRIGFDGWQECTRKAGSIWPSSNKNSSWNCIFNSWYTQAFQHIRYRTLLFKYDRIASYIGTSNWIARSSRWYCITCGSFD